jgi:hypothetical protein
MAPAHSTTSRLQRTVTIRPPCHAVLPGASGATATPARNAPQNTAR